MKPIHVLKKTLSIFFLITTLIVSYNTSTYAQTCPDDADGDGYSDADVAVLQQIAANNDPSGSLDWTGTDYGSWSGPRWTNGTGDCSGVQYVQQLHLRSSYMLLEGSMDISGFQKIEVMLVPDRGLSELHAQNLEFLNDLQCQNNMLTVLDVSGCTALSNINAENNDLTVLNIAGCSSLQVLNCPSNELVNLDISDATSLAELIAFDNNITQLNLGASSGLGYVEVQNNALPISSLKGGTGAGYFKYAPQDSVLTNITESTGVDIDYSAEVEVDGVPTQFVWKDESGNMLVKGTDYEESLPGVFSFLRGGTFHVEMTNANLPSLSDANVLIAKAVSISSCDDDLDGDGFYDADVAVLQHFVDYNSNGAYLNWNSSFAYDMWSGVTWTDGNASCANLKRIKALDISDKGVRKEFTAEGLDSLQTLLISGNHFTELNVNNLTALKTLEVNGSELSTLDASTNTALTKLDCQSNALASVSISPLATLEELHIENNNIKMSDLSLALGTPIFTYAPQDSVFENSELQIGEVLNYQSEASINGVSTNFKWISAFSGLQLIEGTHYITESPGVFSFLTNGRFFCEMTNASLPDFNGADVMLGRLVTVNCELDANNDGYADRDVQLLRFIKLYNDWSDNLNWYGSDIVTWEGITWADYDTPECGSLKMVQKLALPNKGLRGRFKPDGLSKLEDISIEQNNIDSIIITDLNNLINLNCHSNQLNYLDFGDLTEIEVIRCYGNNLKELDMSNLKNLQSVYCYENELTELNVSGCDSLIELFADYNELSELNVIGLNRLQTLNVARNNITHLKLGDLPALSILECQFNDLDSIDIETSSRTLLNYNNSYNNLPLSQLKKALGATTYTYAPQDSIYDNYIVPVNQPVDYSLESDVNGSATVFTWYYADGTLASEGVDYLVDAPGVFKFYKPGKFYVEMSNANLPDLIDTKVMVAKMIEVTSRPIIAREDKYRFCNHLSLEVDSSLGVLSNDIGLNELPLSAQLVNDVSNGTLNLNANGSFTYVPNEDFSGFDFFSYQATDQVELSNEVEVRISALAFPDTTLEVVDDSICIGEEASITLKTSELDVLYYFFIDTAEYEYIGTGNDLNIDLGALQNSTSFAIYASVPYGCGGYLADSATVIVNPLPDSTLNLIGDTVCYGDSAIITIVSSELNTEYFISDGDDMLSAVGTGTNVEVKTGPRTRTTDYTVEASNENGCMVLLNNKATVAIAPLPIETAEISGAVIVPKEIGYVEIYPSEVGVSYFVSNDTSTYTGTGNGDTLRIYTESLLYSTTYTLTAVSEFGCSISLGDVEVKVSLSFNSENMPQGFSPNGDGINDVLEIIGLEDYPENEIIVFNTWGKEVFRAKPYKNDWGGTQNGKLLPEGTYYYVLKVSGRSEELKNYVYINY